MKIRFVALAMLLVGGTLAFAQSYLCPSSGPTCLVPSRAMSATRPVATSPYGFYQSTVPVASAQQWMQPSYSYGIPRCASGRCSTNACPAPCPMPCPTACPVPCPTVCPTTCPTTYPVGGMTSAAPCPFPGCNTACLSPDTNCLLSGIQGLQATIRGTALISQGQELIGAMNDLMMDEMLFRQQFVMNPNATTGIQSAAMLLQNRASSLNNRIAAFNRTLASIPVDQRQYLTCDLNTFYTVSWTPAITEFSTYVSQFPQSATSIYQTAFNNNSWLPTWQSNYQAALNNIVTVQQTYATVTPWWSGGPLVLGSQEELCSPCCPIAPAQNMISTIPTNIQVQGSMEQLPSAMPTMPTMPAQRVPSGEVHRPLQ